MRDVRRARAGAVGALTLLAVLVVASTGSFRLSTRPLSGGAPPIVQVTLPPLPTQEPIEGGDSMGDLALGDRVGQVSLIVLGLIALVAAVALVVVLRRVVRMRRDAPAQADDPPQGLDALPVPPELTPLRRGLAAAQAALDDPDRPPRDAVVAAWLALEQAAARTGVTRDRAQTPTQYAQAVLGATPADPAATRGLLGLYLVARFSEHPVGLPEVTAARAHLLVLARTLDVPAGAGVHSHSASQPAGEEP